MVGIPQLREAVRNHRRARRSSPTKIIFVAGNISALHRSPRRSPPRLYRAAAETELNSRPSEASARRDRKSLSKIPRAFWRPEDRKRETIPGLVLRKLAPPPFADRAVDPKNIRQPLRHSPPNVPLQ